MATMKVNKRQETGSRKMRSVRKAGMVPGIIYGHGLAPVPVALNLRELETLVHGGERLLELDIDGQAENVLVKEVQYDHLNETIMHIDLARVNLDERVEVTVPIMLRGIPAGAADGGVLNQVLAMVKLECLVTAIPDDIRASVTEMKVGEVLHLKDLQLPEGAKLVGDPEQIVATLSVIAEVVEAVVAEEGAAEPEVIGAKKEEEAEGEEAPAKPEKKAKE